MQKLINKVLMAMFSAILLTALSLTALAQTAKKAAKPRSQTAKVTTTASIAETVAAAEERAQEGDRQADEQDVVRDEAGRHEQRVPGGGGEHPGPGIDGELHRRLADAAGRAPVSAGGAGAGRVRVREPDRTAAHRARSRRRVRRAEPQLRRVIVHAADQHRLRHQAAAVPGSGDDAGRQVRSTRSAGPQDPGQRLSAAPWLMQASKK